MKMRAAAIDTPGALQGRMEASLPPAELAALPDFYALPVESGTSRFFHATPDGFDPDIVPVHRTFFPRIRPSGTSC
ncbi:hypothetical protein B0G84_6096 [Paraburkholderia sp. BL8N3]|jgi:hypothetical protein|nr:hypothetical protein [Paraburkholderia sp. BL8N3]TCK37060.1 hypothetical protein B0G84_6096 [Paraburkholderia sp. BL8N3]